MLYNVFKEVNVANFKYLIKVEPNANNNKFYRMIDNGDSFEAQYGRVGSGYQIKTYPMSKWEATYRSKLKKGYEDKTDLVANIVAESGEVVYKEIPNEIVRKIVQKLQSYARKAIKENYTISSRAVTQKMVDDAQISIDKLFKIEDMDDFNKELVNLFMIIPRKMSSVSDYLAKDTLDYQVILPREQDLLDIMSGQVIEQSLETSEEDTSKVDKTILEIMGIDIQPITRQESILIKQQLGEISNKYSDAWKIVNIKTQKRYDNFINDNDIQNIRMLWHGTRSENVWSILNTGLALRPNAIITGKMFGHGIYFAPKARKSLGYTSLSGSYWTKGGQNEGYMLLFDVAYGNPCNVYDFNSKFHNLDYDKLQQFEANTNCLHAHSSKGMLRNDEIIVYKEEQVTVKYLIQLKED